MQKRIVKNNAENQKSSSKEEKIDILLKEKKFKEAKNELFRRQITELII